MLMKKRNERCITKIMFILPWIILASLSTLSGTASHNATAKFAKDYFLNRMAHHIVVLSCWDKTESVDFSRFLMNPTNLVSYVPISEELDMERVLKVNYYRLGIFVNFDCPKSEMIFRQFSDQQLRHNESYWWLIVTKEKAVPTDLFSTLPLTVATEMTVALQRNDSYELFDVYNPSYKHGARLNVTFMGRWSFQEGLQVKLTQYKYKRRGNFYGLTLNASVALNFAPDDDIIKYMTVPKDPGFDTMHRFNYGLIVQLQAYYNFTMNIKRGTTWGYLLPNGTWNGILGDMSRGLVDISITPFSVKTSRMDVVEWTVQTWLVKVCFIFRHPQKNELSNVFLKPFVATVWYLVVITGVVNWLLLYLTVRIEQHYNWQEPSNTLDTNPASEVALIAIAAICQQGLSDGPRIYSGRIVFLFLFLWALLMFQFYSGCVVGFLLVEKPRFIITPQDLLDSSLAVGSEDLAYNVNWFKNEEHPMTRQLYDKKMGVDKVRKKRPFFPIEEGLKMVKKGGFAFHTDTATAYKIIEETFEENEICELQEILLFPPRHTALGLMRHSPFRKMVTYGMRQILEHGTSARLRSIWYPRRPQCPESHSSTPLPVEIKDFSPALFVIMFGCGFSFFVMILEKLIIRITT